MVRRGNNKICQFYERRNMKYLITYNYDDWNKDDCVGIETCYTVDEVNDAINSIKLGLYDDGEHQRNIRVYKAEEVTDEFDTKTEFDLSKNEKD